MDSSEAACGRIGTLPAVARRELTEEEQAIFNAGERLIPGVSMGVAELVRHRSSYLFFRRAIEDDLALLDPRAPITVADLGCGVGHGCCTIAEAPGTHVVGFDNSRQTLDYARRHYARPNVEYELADLAELMPRLREYDYVVSRGALEHVPRGLDLVRSIRARFRIMFDVPFGEAADANPHHQVHDVREDAFAGFADTELFFQDLWGTMYDRPHKPRRPNMIMSVMTRGVLPPLTSRLEFPIEPWRPAARRDELRLLLERAVVFGGMTKRRLSRAARRITPQAAAER